MFLSRGTSVPIVGRHARFNGVADTDAIRADTRYHTSQCARSISALAVEPCNLSATWPCRQEVAAMERAAAAVAAYPYRGITAAIYTWCCRGIPRAVNTGRLAPFVRGTRAVRTGIGRAPDKLHQGGRIEG